MICSTLTALFHTDVLQKIQENAASLKHISFLWISKSQILIFWKCVYQELWSVAICNLKLWNFWNYSNMTFLKFLSSDTLKLWSYNIQSNDSLISQLLMVNGHGSRLMPQSSWLKARGQENLALGPGPEGSSAAKFLAMSHGPWATSHEAWAMGLEP